MLLLDDDRAILEIYKELIARLPSRPDVQVADSGAAAVSLLETEEFNLLVSDLRMAEMDGFQVLAIVRRRHPALRTVVMTALNDAHFRARAYALGVDLFIKKPTTAEEWEMLCDSIEWLLQSEAQGGFRGIQNKSLVDIIQLECLSHCNSVLRIINGPAEGWIWFDSGEIIDSAHGDLTGEAAFRAILAWKSGYFEILPPDKGRERAIFNSYQSLLLESAQTIDENRSLAGHQTDMLRGPVAEDFTRYPGVKFVVSADGPETVEAWGVENAEPLAVWIRTTMERFHKLGLDLQLGPVTQLDGVSGQTQLVVVSAGPRDICLGMDKHSTSDQLRQTLEKVLSKWNS
ncbi:MAG: response regulator [Verrucomicrobia bacterium]|nr:response regulator [Verrucomicrobiota bacterium]